MTKGFIRRYLKLLPQRAGSSLRPHLLPISAVAILIILTLFGLASLPQTQKQISSAPTSGATPSTSKSKITQLTSIPVDMSRVPVLSAKNVFIMDLHTNQVLYQKNADEQIYPASTTKITTALVVLNHFNLQDTIVVDKAYPEGQTIGVQPGEKFTVENLLYALLIQSANDVAEVFAQAYPGGRPAFVTEMNKTVTDLGLQHTYFKNPTGLDEEGHFSSAADLSRLAAQAMRNPLFKRIVSTENSIIDTQDHQQSFILTNTNELLGKIPGVLGVKTGFTEKAGESLISEVDRDNKNVLIAILGSQDRFGDTHKLINWLYSDSSTTASVSGSLGSQ